MSGRVLPFRRAGADEASDEALIAACALGDPDALARLFDRHHLRVHRFLCRVASTDASAGEDLLQETFTLVWKSAGRFQGDAKALTWIFGIAANVARHHVRGRGRRLRALAGLRLVEPVPPVEPGTIAERREALALLGAALDALPHDLRVAFVLCELEGVPGVDAARALDVRPGTLWRRLHEARKSLRAALEEVRP